MVRMAGLEPALPSGKQILSLLRLPISPHPRTIATQAHGATDVKRPTLFRVA